MPDLMSSVDLMVTKAGGLTTFEAIARRLPLAFDLITEPMPQEKGTAEMMIEQKLAYAIHRPDDIIDVVENFQPVPNRAKQKMPSEHNYDLTDTAVYTIAEKVLNMIGITVPAVQAVEDTEQEPLYVKVS
jgi:UDP-N-acetylglucosamine:LPS N-acetylglucosamine transferase